HPLEALAEGLSPRLRLAVRPCRGAGRRRPAADAGRPRARRAAAVVRRMAGCYHAGMAAVQLNPGRLLSEIGSLVEALADFLDGPESGPPPSRSEGPAR